MRLVHLSTAGVCHYWCNNSGPFLHVSKEGHSPGEIVSLILVLTIIYIHICPLRKLARPDTTFAAPCTNNFQCQNVNLCIAYSNLFLRYVYHFTWSEDSLG